jgi:hypothetical protein
VPFSATQVQPRPSPDLTMVLRLTPGSWPAARMFKHVELQPALQGAPAIRLGFQPTLDNGASADSGPCWALFGCMYHRHVFRPARLDS